MNELLMNMFPGMNSIGMSSGIDSQLAAPNLQDGGMPFVDVLGLVSDMEVADSQLGTGPLFLDKTSEDVLKSHRESLLGKDPMVSLEALANSGMAAVKVGQEANMKSPLLETLAVKVNAATPKSNPIDLSQEIGIGSLALQRAPQIAPELNLRSAAIWTAALESGDLKSVEMLPQQDKSAIQLKNALAKNEMGSNEVLPQNLAAKAVASQENLKVGELSQNILRAKSEMPVAKDSKNSEAPDVSVKTGFKKWVPERVESVVEQKEISDKGPSSEKKDFHKDSKPQDAGNFVLNRMQSQEKKINAETFQAPFVDQSKIGSSSDRRISSEALNFVGERVQDLKNAGGGEIRVDLHPKDMGAVEIRVGMKAGKMEVTISAEKTETLQVLLSSSEQLKGKLNQIASSDLKVVAKGYSEAKVSGNFESPKASAAPVRNETSTQDLMSMRDLKSQSSASAPKAGLDAAVASESHILGAKPMGVTSSDVKEIGRSNIRMESARGADSQMGEPSSDGRRDVWEKWEEYQKKKSA